MSAEPVPVPAERSAAGAAVPSRGLHAVPDEAQRLPADLLYGRLLANAALHAAGAHDEPVPLKCEVRGVEEVDLADLGVERVHPERAGRRAVVLLGDCQLEFGAVRAVEQPEVVALQRGWLD